MKITFFKNESHFYKKRHIFWDHAQKAEKKSLFRYIALLLSLGAILILNLTSLGQRAVSWLLILPINELCHALFCLLSGSKVERICFLPYKNILKAIAYVQPKFDVWSKRRWALFIAFPLLLLTVLPILLALFLQEQRFNLYSIALINLVISYRDVEGLLNLFVLPKNTICAGTLWLIPQGEKAVELHRIALPLCSQQIEHSHFRYAKGKVTKVIPPQETEEIKTALQQLF